MSEISTGEPNFRYTAQLAGEIENKWQDLWDERGTFFADNPEGDLAGDLASRDPFFLLDMFPYPSGKGLHVGHPLGYIATDTVARFHRMRGENVLYTMGYDAFGLPAEQFAVQTGQHPRVTTEENIANMRRQLRRLGLSHDRRRSFATTDVDYVHWTQWIFLQVFNSWFDPQAPRRDGRGLGAARPISELVAQFESGERELPEEFSARSWNELSPRERARVVDSYRLAYISEAPVNWCPGLGTVLANEEVTAEGRSERGNYPVFKRSLRQWMMRITAYGDRLIEDLDTIDWPEKVRTMQRNWIGRSHGAEVDFRAVVMACQIVSSPFTRHVPIRSLVRPSWSGLPSIPSLVEPLPVLPRTRLRSNFRHPGRRELALSGVRAMQLLQRQWPLTVHRLPRRPQNSAQRMRGRRPVSSLVCGQLTP